MIGSIEGRAFQEIVENAVDSVVIGLWRMQSLEVDVVLMRS